MDDHATNVKLAESLAMKITQHGQSGFSLMETMFAIGILSVGALGMVGMFAKGMTQSSSSPSDVTATQKAAEAIESVFSARDSHILQWTQLRNVSQGGIFKDGALPMTTAGADGLVGTADDGPVENVDLPGRDQRLGTADDVTQTLDHFTRKIQIADIETDLRSITVTITYKTGTETRTYVLTSYISNFA
jgi:prepilin-type N-terminal cleavage/methylation domain-containing protein